MEGTILNRLTSLLTGGTIRAKAIGEDSATGTQYQLRTTAGGLLRTAVESVPDDAWTEYTKTWTNNAGVVEIEITGIPAGKYWVTAVSWTAVDSGPGAVSVTVYASTDTGFTPGNAAHGFYTSDAAAALPSQRYWSPTGRVPITVGVAGKIYVRAVPNALETDGSISVYLSTAL